MYNAVNIKVRVWREKKVGEKRRKISGKSKRGHKHHLLPSCELTNGLPSVCTTPSHTPATPSTPSIIII
jgi:hypothetical protein